MIHFVKRYVFFLVWERIRCFALHQSRADGYDSMDVLVSAHVKA